MPYRETLEQLNQLNALKAFGDRLIELWEKLKREYQTEAAESEASAEEGRDLDPVLDDGDDVVKPAQSPQLPFGAWAFQNVDSDVLALVCDRLFGAATSRVRSDIKSGLSAITKAFAITPNFLCLVLGEDPGLVLKRATIEALLSLHKAQPHCTMVDIAERFHAAQNQPYLSSRKPHTVLRHVISSFGYVLCCCAAVLLSRDSRC